MKRSSSHGSLPNVRANRCVSRSNSFPPAATTSLSWRKCSRARSQGRFSRLRPPDATRLGDLLASVRERLDQAVGALATPAAVEILDSEVMVSGAGETAARITYAALQALASEAEEMLELQLRRAVDMPDLRVELRFAATSRAGAGAPPEAGTP